MKLNVIPKFIAPYLADERKTAAISGFLLFTTIAAFIILKSARDALFLHSFQPHALPYYMALTTFITALAAAFYLRVYKLTSVERGVKLSLFIFSAGTLLFWSGMHDRAPRTISIFYAWVSLYGSLASVQVWLLISRQFLTRQARRQIGVIGAGGVIGGIVGGLLARFTTQFWSVGNLIPLSAGLIFCAFLASLMLSPPGSTISEKIPDPEPPKVGKKLIVLMLLVVALGTLASSFIEFQFKTTAQHALRSAHNLAIFFGSFYAYTSAASLFIQLLITPFLMRRFGITVTLSLLPIALMFTNGFALAAMSFATIISIRGAEELFKHSIDRSSLEVLYVAIPEREKVRLKSLIDTVGVRAAEGIGAALLIVLFSVANIPLRTLLIINVAFIASWLVSAVLLGKEYPHLLRKRIQRKELDPERVKDHLFGSDFYRFLPQLFREGEKQNILDLLEILESSGRRWLSRYLVIPLQSQDPEVRLKALRVLFHQDGNLSSNVKELLADPDRLVRAEAIHYLSLHSDVKKKKGIKFLEDPDPLIQAVTCAYALKHKPKEEIVYEKLEQLIKESMAKSELETRLEIAHVLEFARPSEPVARLCTLLLNDDDLEIRKAALKTIAAVHPPGVVPRLIRLTRDTSLVKEVRAALASYGELLVPRLRQILSSSDVPELEKKLVIKIVGDIGGPNSLDFLLEAATEKDLFARYAALKSMNRLRKAEKIPTYDTVLAALMEEELARLEKDFKLHRGFSPQLGHLFATLLRQRRHWAAERIFRILGLLYDPTSIYDAYHAWISGDFRKTDTALEYLDTTIKMPLRERILPLLEFNLPPPLADVNGNEKQGSNVLTDEEFESGILRELSTDEKFVEETIPRKTAFFSFLAEKDPVLAAVAIADLSEEEIQEWKEEIQKEVDSFSSKDLVQETLNWRLDMNEKNSDESTLTTVQKMEILGKTDTFSNLGAQELLLLADFSELTIFEADTEIFKEGGLPQEVYCLIEGSVTLKRSSGHIKKVTPGETFGLPGVLVNKPHIFSATAETRSTCLRLERESFRELLEEYPSIMKGIFCVLVDQIEGLTAEKNVTESV